MYSNLVSVGEGDDALGSLADDLDDVGQGLQQVLQLRVAVVGNPEKDEKNRIRFNFRMKKFRII